MQGVPQCTAVRLALFMVSFVAAADESGSAKRAYPQPTTPAALHSSSMQQPVLGSTLRSSQRQSSFSEAQVGFCSVAHGNRASGRSFPVIFSLMMMMSNKEALQTRLRALRA